jgi:hypothetical protein
LSISRVQHSISFQAPKLEDREGGKKKQDGHERRRKLAVPAVSTHKCHNKPYTIKLSQQYLPESTQSISMSPPPRTAADGCAEHDARAEAGRRAAAFVPWCVESWAGAESTSPGSLADRGRCFGPDCQLCALHPGMRDVASPSRPFAICLLPPASGASFSDNLSLPSCCGCCRCSACAASRASSTTCRRAAACSMLADL